MSDPPPFFIPILCYFDLRTSLATYLGNNINQPRVVFSFPTVDSLPRPWLFPLRFSSFFIPPLCCASITCYRSIILGDSLCLVHVCCGCGNSVSSHIGLIQIIHFRSGDRVSKNNHRLILSPPLSFPLFWFRPGHPSIFFHHRPSP